MPIEVNCSSCGAPIKAPDKLGGKIIKCPRCQERIILPEAAIPSEPEPAAQEQPKPAPEPKQDAAPTEEKAPEAKAPDRPKQAPQPAGPGRLRLSVGDGFRLGLGLMLAVLLAWLLYLGGFWGLSQLSKSVKKEWDEKVDKGVAKTMGGDFTVPNDPLPQLPPRIMSLKAGKIWHGAKRGAHIIVATHSFLANPQDLRDIQEYLQAGQWMNYAKNLMFILVDLGQSGAGGSEIEYKPVKTLRVLMNDGQTFTSADLAKARRDQADQGPWESMGARLRNLEALFGHGAVQPGARTSFVAFMPETLDVNKIKAVYWHLSASRRVKLEPYKR